jgi:hypothetical protein
LPSLRAGEAARDTEGKMAVNTTSNIHRRWEREKPERGGFDWLFGLLYMYTSHLRGADWQRRRTRKAYLGGIGTVCGLLIREELKKGKGKSVGFFF